MPAISLPYLHKWTLNRCKRKWILLRHNAVDLYLKVDLAADLFIKFDLLEARHRCDSLVTIFERLCVDLLSVVID